MGRFTLILFVVAVQMLSFLSAQDYVLTNYSLEEGIPQSSILAIYQDTHGNMWFGSQGGISKYNGHEFENFDSRHGLAGNHITSMIQDKKGRYWIGHRYKGLSLLFQKKFLTIDLTEDRVNCLKEDKKGNIWIGTHGKGIYMLPESSKPLLENFIQIKLSNGISDYNVYDIVMLENHIMVGTSIGLIQLDFDGTVENIKSEIFTPENSSLPFFHIYSFISTKDSLWAMGQEGLISMKTDNELDMHEVAFYPIEKQVDAYFIQNITMDKNGMIWGVHSHGVYRFKNGEYDFDFYGTNLKNHETNAIFSDKEGNIWIGTMNNGVLKYSDDRFRVFNDNSGLPSNVVTSVIKDSKGNLWVATPEGVCKFDGSGYEYFTEKQGLPHKTVQVLFEDLKGNIWMGYYSDHPLIRYNPNSGTFVSFSKKDGLTTNSILTIEEDKEGNIWFATLGHGVTKFTYGKKGQKGKFQSYSIEDGLCSNSFWTLHNDQAGNLWFGSDNEGLSRFDGHTFQSYSEKDGLSNTSPAAIAHDSKNNLWIASIGGGIFKFDGHNFTNYSIDKGLSSDSPFSIMCDENDKVWIGTNIGIDRFDPETESFKTYGREDGFLGIENNQNSIFKEDSGIIWFGTMNGVVRFDPSKDVLNTIPPVTLVENIQLFFNDFDYKDHSDTIHSITGVPSTLHLKHNLNHLTFECIGITHKAPKKIKYRYFLENFDTEWNPVTSATSITYTNVPHGKYTFHVKTCNNDGIWNTDPVKMEVFISPPFWQTWWFRSLAIVFIVGMIYSVFWLRLKSIKSQKTLLETLVDEKTLELKHEAEERKAAQIRAEESDKLKTAFLANMSHEIRTPVNAIIGFSDLIKDTELSEEDRNIYLDYITGGGKSLLTLINDIIDISKIEAGELRIIKESCNLENLLAEVFMTFHEEIKSNGKNNLELILEKPKIPITSDILTDPHRLKQVLSNLLNNALKFTDQGSVVFGYKILDEQFLHFFVKDTGIGIPTDKLDVIFHRFRQVEDAYTRNYDGTGLGLTISRKLCRLIGGDMWVNSVTGKGSTFSFTIPFTTEEHKSKYLNLVTEVEIADTLKNKNILVVEDIDSNFVLIENMLQGLDLNVIRAEDGLKAVDMFRRNGRTIDLVLMDIKIPGLNGYDATREIKKIKSKVPIVAQTAYAMQTEKQNCLDAGCDDYISKPYNKQELLSVIQKNIIACNSYY